jgi:hypothetical protein
MADDVEVRFGANIQQLTEAVNQVKAQLGSLTGVASQVGGYFSQLSSIGTLLAGTLGTLGLESFARHMAESGVETEKLTIALGVSSGELAKLKAVAGLTGVDMGGLALTMERLSLNIQRSTRDAFTPQAEALKVIGLNAKDLIGLNAAQMFDRIAQAAARFNSSLNLTNALMAIGGRGMAEMVAAFVKGGGEFKELSDKIAKAKGDTDEFARAATETHLALGFMDATVSGLSKDIFLKLKPSIDTIITSSREFVQEIRASIKEGGLWSNVLDGVALALKSIVVMMGLGTLALKESVAAVIYWRAIWSGADPVKALKDFAEAAVTAAGDFTKMMDRLSGLTKETKNAAEAMTDARNRLATLMGQASGASSSVGKFNQTWNQLMKDMGKEAGAIDFGGKERLQAQMKAIEDQIKLVELGFEKQKVLYDKDVINFRMTEAQKVQATSAASSQRYAAEIALLQQELQLGGLTLVQQQEISAKIVELKQKEVIDRLRLENDYILKVREQWQFLESALQNSLNASLRGLLQGTMTFKNAMKNIFQELVFAIINEFTKLAIVKPMIAALSDAFAPAELLSNVLKMISKFIGQVFSGATAFFAPTLGPAAPAAGAAVAAATEATALSYDTGAWAVPQTAHALVHRDEMILPVDMASAVRAIVTGGQGMGGAPANISIQAWDGASVMKWLRGGGVDVIAKALSGHYQANPASRPNF